MRFTYDTFARRVEKRVERPGAAPVTVRYAWCGDVMVHETRIVTEPSGDRVIEERSFLPVPDSLLPIAQRITRDGQSGPLATFVFSPNGQPEALLLPDGRATFAADRSLTGQTAGLDTPLRALGQYDDADTGLHYNRLRYFDPETGMYISPEPLGIAGSLQAYGYADGRPFDLIDPDGMVPCRIYDRNGNVIAQGNSGSSAPLHPAVQAAMPPNNVADNRVNNAPNTCAEPRALTNHLNEYEWNGVPPDQRTGTPPRSCRPGDPGWQANLQGAMDKIRPTDGIQTASGTGNYPACPNCSQTVPRLYAMAGRQPPNDVLGRGSGGARPPIRSNDPPQPSRATRRTRPTMASPRREAPPTWVPGRRTAAADGKRLPAQCKV